MTAFSNESDRCSFNIGIQFIPRLDRRAWLALGSLASCKVALLPATLERYFGCQGEFLHGFEEAVVAVDVVLREQGWRRLLGGGLLDRGAVEIALLIHVLLSHTALITKRLLTQNQPIHRILRAVGLGLREVNQIDGITFLLHIFLPMIQPQVNRHRLHKLLLQHLPRPHRRVPPATPLRLI